jgi:LmeA-like phospholipid-binding
MSSDPTRPLPEWRQQQQPPEWPQQPAQWPQQQGSGWPQQPGRGEPPTMMGRPPGPPPRRRRRGPFILLITLLVIVVLLVVSDRVANAYTENQMASQVQSSLGLSGKPTVNIHGFPYWTQLAARDFKTVTVTGSNETINSPSAGGGALEIASLNATLHGLHIHGTNSASVDQFDATALVTFTALGSVGGIPQGITLSQDGGNRIKANISLGPFSETAVAEVTQTGTNKINIKIIDAGDIPTEALGNLADFSVTIPKLPSGVTIQKVSVTQQGIQVALTGHNTDLSQS